MWFTRFLIYTFLYLTILWSNPVMAVTTVQSQPDKTWTLSSLTDLALTINPDTKLAWAQVKAAAANVGIAKSAYWPQLDFNADASFTTHENNDNNSNDFGCSSSDKYCANLTINYLVWDFGVTRQQVKNANYQLIATQLNQNEAIQQVILQVEQAYYQLLGLQALVKADQISLKEAKTNLDAAKALHNQGLATIGDVYQAESTLSQAQLTLQQAEGELSIGRGQLATAVGLPVQTNLKIADVSNQFEHDAIMHNVKLLLDKAKNQRPDLQAAEAQVTAAQAQVQATKDQRWPTLAFTASTEHADAVNTFTVLNRQSNVMLTLNYPVFTGFQQTNQIRQAQAQEQEAEATRDQLANQVDMQVWQAYYALKTARKSILTSQAYLKTSIQAANQTLGQYRAGVGNILSVLTTQTTEATARVQLIQSTLNWYLALAQLMQAIGALQAPISKQM